MAVDRIVDPGNEERFPFKNTIRTLMLVVGGLSVVMLIGLAVILPEARMILLAVAGFEGLLFGFLGQKGKGYHSLTDTHLIIRVGGFSAPRIRYEDIENVREDVDHLPHGALVSMSYGMKYIPGRKVLIARSGGDPMITIRVKPRTKVSMFHPEHIVIGVADAPGFVLALSKRI